MHQAPLYSSASDLEQENIPLIILISVIAAIGGCLFGYDSGVVNGTTEGLKKAGGSALAFSGLAQWLANFAITRTTPAPC